MDPKHYTDVIIAGRVYTLGGQEEEDYLQRVAAYLNGKFDEFRRVNGFMKQSPEYQSILMQLNVADDYFQARKKAEELEQKVLNMEKEAYELKHALITEQMKKEVLEEKVEMLEEELSKEMKTPRHNK